MASNNHQNRNQQQALDINNETINLFLETQRQKANTEALEVRLREKEIELNAKGAEKALDYQAEHLRNQPKEMRETIKVFIYGISAFIIIVLAFIGFCLYIGKDEAAKTILNIISYVVVSLISYFLGKGKTRKSGSKKEDDDVEIVS